MRNSDKQVFNREMIDPASNAGERDRLGQFERALGLAQDLEHVDAKEQCKRHASPFRGETHFQFCDAELTLINPPTKSPPFRPCAKSLAAPRPQ